MRREEEKIIKIRIYILIPLITLIRRRPLSARLWLSKTHPRVKRVKRGYKSFSLGNTLCLGKVITPYHPDHYLGSPLGRLSPCP